MTGSSMRPEQRLFVAGDRYYTLARVLVLGLLLVLDLQINQHAFWPPSSHPYVLTWWLYAVFTGLSFAIPLLAPLDAVRPWLFLVDLGFLAALALLSNLPPTLFFALFLLPTVWAAIRRRPRAALLTGSMAAVLYAGTIWLYQRSSPIDVQTLFGLALNVISLIFVSWLTSTLAEQRSTVNRQLVDVARHETTVAVAEAQSYRDRAQALYQVAYQLGTTTNYQSVLDTAVRECLRLVQASTGVVLLSTGGLDELYVAAGHGLREGDLHQRIHIDPQGLLAKTFSSGTPVNLDAPGSYPDMTPVAALARCRHACLVPLRAGRRNYGILAVGREQAVPFTNDDLGVVVALANYAIVSMLNAQLVSELREERTKLISKEEQVRQQLSRDLHDGPAQSMAAIAMNIEFVKRLLDRDPERVRDELTRMADLARRTTYDIRTLLFELRPLTLESQGLVATLREYITRFKDAKTEVVLEEHVDNIQLDAKREGTLFNIIQESVNNAMKHAQAKHIWIRLNRQGDELMATVQDDGKGFDLQAIKRDYNKRGSFGLLNIEERARMSGGSAELNSAPGAGTTVRVIVPINAESI